MFQWIIDIWNKFVQWLDYIFEQILGFISSIVDWAVNMLVSMLPSSFTDGSWFSFDVSGLAMLTDSLLYIFPVGAMIGVIIATWTLVGAIRIIRWIIGFVPTVEG